MKRRLSLGGNRPPAPFATLVTHFVKRMFASDEDQGSGAVSLGLGAVLAILASPGAFASIFLMDKYSTLLQWFRGQTNFNPYRASVADEYFFVVLSMTVTGLIMVLRWNRLLPDAADFLNLAVLPIPIRNIFLANFAALIGLALLFGIDLNAVSSFLFPVFVTVSDGSFPAFARLATAHLAAVFLASLFSFFAVFALVGLLMLLTPKRLFRPLSIAVRMALVILLLSVFLSNLFLQLFSGRLPHLRDLYMRWLPSYWFLGIYETIGRFASPTMKALAAEAVTALCAAIVIAVVAYALCYRRHFLRLSEAMDLAGPRRRSFRIALPCWWERVLFRSDFEHACIAFMRKVLLRSERHLMFLGGYIGIGLVLSAQMAASSASRHSGTNLPNDEWLAVPLIMAISFVTGLRFAFDIPAALPAHWIFRIGAGTPIPAPAAVARKFILWTVLPWETLGLGFITAREFGWAVAIEHVATVVVLTVLLIDASLYEFHKIPFTYRAQLDSRRLLFRMLAPLFGVLIVAPGLAAFEHWMLVQPVRFTALGILAGTACYCLRRHNREALPYQQAISFEQQSTASFELLKLS